MNDITDDKLQEYAAVLTEAHFTDAFLTKNLLRAKYGSLTAFVSKPDISFWTNWNSPTYDDRGKITFEQVLELLKPEDRNVLLFHLDLFT